MKIDILYEDGSVVVVNKPALLVVHPDGKKKEPALTDWLLKKYPKLKGVGEPFQLEGGIQIDRPGIVHRLDRETSGALVVAKTAKAFAFLKQQFQARAVEKKYHAFVYGEMKNNQGTIDRPIGRSKNDFRRWTAERGARGQMREAKTSYKVLARKDGLSFVEVMPKTGRTHQIRVHFKAISHPVVGDSLYAPNRQPALGFKRLALHARSVKFQSLKGKEVAVEAPYPTDFKVAIAQIKAI